VPHRPTGTPPAGAKWTERRRPPSAWRPDPVAATTAAARKHQCAWRAARREGRRPVGHGAAGRAEADRAAAAAGRSVSVRLKQAGAVSAARIAPRAGRPCCFAFARALRRPPRLLLTSSRRLGWVRTRVRRRREPTGCCRFFTLGARAAGLAGAGQPSGHHLDASKR